MDIRFALKNREKRFFDKMPPGKRLEYAIRLSEFASKLSLNLKTHGKRIQGDSRGLKRS